MQGISGKLWTCFLNAKDRKKVLSEAILWQLVVGSLLPCDLIDTWPQLFSESKSNRSHVWTEANSNSSIQHGLALQMRFALHPQMLMRKPNAHISLQPFLIARMSRKYISENVVSRARSPELLPWANWCRLLPRVSSKKHSYETAISRKRPKSVD